jgi:glycosyltransferase involved in cell wall biosynthesis/GT2 family glycosyltransferase
VTDATQPVTLSVIIPTYNRVDRLKRVLEALAAQDCDTPFEVIVVSDGSTDGTDEYLRSGPWPVPIRAVTQANGGPAAARNGGLKEARGELVLFIDDDVVPEPGLVSAHLRRHAAAPDDLVVIGPMLTPTDSRLRPWVAWEQAMLDKQYVRFEQEPEAHPRQFYTGNASASRRRIVDVGGFDARFRRAEDVELAYRLHEAGLHFMFEPGARAHHYADRSESSWCDAAYQYGRNDVTFAAEGVDHLLPAISFEFGRRHAAQRWMVLKVLPHRRLSALTRLLLSWLGRASAAVRVDGVSAQIYSGLFGLLYYRGVADELGSTDELIALLTDGRFETRLPTAFVLEQTLGHVTHGNNLQRILDDSPELNLAFVLVEPVRPSSLLARIPVLSNWTLQAGLRARRGLRRICKPSQVGAMFVHTQVPAVLLGRWMRAIPTIVSLDATPVQYDELGLYYAHDTSAGWIEQLKKRANRRCFVRAVHLVTWSSWARQSLVADYGIDADKITVIPPGVDLTMWERPPALLSQLSLRNKTATDGDTVRLLFVGGDLARKGGDLLIEATRRLRADPALPDVELHLVTKSTVAVEVGVHVHAGMSPNSPELIALYHGCDIFCLPTLGDCLPMVLSEAGAAGMALVSTDVGAIHEVVRDGETGLLIPPGDLEALTVALRTLVTDSALRQRLAAGANSLVRRDYDATANAHRIVSLLLSVGRRPAADS